MENRCKSVTFVTSKMKQINQDNTMDVQRHLFLRRCFAYICCLLLCFITATTVYAQKVSVKGTVVDTNGDAIIGASVKVLKKSSVGSGRIRNLTSRRFDRCDFFSE